MQSKREDEDCFLTSQIVVSAAIRSEMLHLVHPCVFKTVVYQNGFSDHILFRDRGMWANLQSWTGRREIQLSILAGLYP